MTMQSPQRGFGWLKDKYNPEAVYHRPKAIRLPDTIDWLGFCPPVRDQNGVGACTGFGIGGMAATVAREGSFFTEAYSPTWLYNGARYIEGTLKKDAGAAPDDVFKWAKENGLLFEHFWPFEKVLDTTAPSSERVAQAIKYDNFEVIRVDEGLAGILSSLAEGHCIALGGPWSQRWENPPASGILDDPFGSYIDGGHETFLYGYDQTTQLLFGQNSWGVSYGDKGRYKMPFHAIDWFKVNGGYDAQYLLMSASPVPPKPPKKFLCWTIG
jgi:hypothetical protein